MRKVPKISMNVIIGILVGLGAVVLILSQTNLAISVLVNENANFNYHLISYSSIAISLLVFIFIVRGFARMKEKRLILYFVMAMFAAAGGAIFSWYMFFTTVNRLFDIEEIQKFMATDSGILIMIGSIYLMFIFVVSIFMLIFIVLINRKIKYISYISEEVSRIEKEGFGLLIQEKGNDELTRLSQGINSMSIKLKEKIEYEKKLEKDKNELITNVSHDLRTPLTSIIGYISLLKQNGFQEKEKFDEYMEVVERRITGLNAMINELFEYTKLNSVESVLACSKMDLIILIQHLLNEYEIIYDNHGLKLKKDIQTASCFVKVDRNKIVRVLQNLLDNAKKYAKKNSTVVVQLYEKEDWIYFSIANEIESTNQLDMDHLFDRFYKADTARSENDSSGLGLAIVKRIMELHGGELIAELENNQIRFQIKMKTLP